jgi:serpin B
LDFADPGAVPEINDWVDEATRGRIETILEEIPDEVVMYLINAIYFKGDWTEPFDRSRTRNDSFTGLGGGSLAVRMMQNQGRYGYAWLPDYEAVDLPYGNGAFTMTILLPPDGGDVNTFLGAFDDARWGQIVGTLARGEVVVELPRFRMEYEKTLNDPLKVLGINRAFDDRVADFSGMMDGPPGTLYITEVKHKTFVEVNEEGTEAAAATSVGIGITSAPPTFRVDRPFVFVIRERFSGTILFAGKIVAPETGAS